MVTYNSNVAGTRLKCDLSLIVGHLLCSECWFHVHSLRSFCIFDGVALVMHECRGDCCQPSWIEICGKFKACTCASNVIAPFAIVDNVTNAEKVNSIRNTNQCALLGNFWLFFKSGLE